VEAVKPGFEENPEDAGTVVVPRTTEQPGVEIKLTPLGTIEGRVINQFGEPLEEVMVIVSRTGVNMGRRVRFTVGSVWTDDRGEFQLTRVQPGQYFVKAAGRKGGTETYVGDHSPSYAPWETFSPRYLDGATEIELASPITVTAGTRVRADFRVDAQQAFRILGKLGNYESSEDVTFELLRGDEAAEPNRALLDRATGQFEVLDVPPGTYRLRATHGTRQGEATVTVSGTDVRGVQITLWPATFVKVALHATGSKESGAATCGVTLRESAFDSGGWSAAPTNDGQFGVSDVPPGDYRTDIGCQGGYALSAWFGDTDLLTHPVITISPGAEHRSVVQGRWRIAQGPVFRSCST
jgi:hypothetical protein